MQWVFDASVTMAWCFDDERTPATDASSRSFCACAGSVASSAGSTITSDGW